jgi:hypothetical protein
VKFIFCWLWISLPLTPPPPPPPDVNIYDASLGSLVSGLGGNFFLIGDVVFLAENVTLASTSSGSLNLPTYDPLIVKRGYCKEGDGKGCGRGVYRGGGIYAADRADVELKEVNCFSLHAENSGACLYATGDVALSFDMGVVNASVNTSRAVSLVSMSMTSSFSNIEFGKNTGSFYLKKV